MNEISFTQEQINNCNNNNIKIKHFQVTDSDGICAIIGVRLFGIDSPERGQRYFTESMTKLNQLCNTLKDMQYKGVDKYGRLLCILFNSYGDVNMQLVKNGLAHSIHYTYDEAQEEAKSKKLGLWKDEIIIHPAKYRKQHPVIFT